MTDETGMKAAHVLLRRVQDHLHHTHLTLGAVERSVGMVVVVHHPDTTHTSLNYVTPRRNTAWVSGQQLDEGLAALRSAGQVARVRFAEGLFPPIFARSLRDLDLHPAYEIPVSAWRITSDSSPASAPLPENISITRVEDAASLRQWWHVRHNATPTPPDDIDRLLMSYDQGHPETNSHIQLILKRYDYPVGAARITVHEKSAHLLTQVIMMEVHTSALETALQSAALSAAQAAGCELIFKTGSPSHTRQTDRAAGFMEAGSIVCYAEANDAHNYYNEDEHGALAKSVPLL